MKEDICEYYPSGVKHRIKYYDNGNKLSEEFYDEKGYLSREDNLPAYQCWWKNGFVDRKIYNINGHKYNIYNPYFLHINHNGKIIFKFYSVLKTGLNQTKLNWENKIKQI
jgi:hypothetical protein